MDHRVWAGKKKDDRSSPVWRLAAWLYACQADDRGQTMVEYALLLVLIMMVVIGMVSTIGDTVLHAYYDKIIANMPTVP